MTYETVYGVVNDFNLDINHWINKESLISKKKFEAIQVNFCHIPEELLSFTLKCENNHLFVPNWLEKIPPLSPFFCSKKGLLRLSSCSVKCPICQTHTPYVLPQAPYKGNINVYGDEAMREVDNKTIFTYSFISFSGTGSNRKDFEKEFFDLKKNFTSSKSPEKWRLHMKELFTTEKRQGASHLRHLDFENVLTGMKNILNLIKKYNDLGHLNIHSAIGIAHGTKLQKQVLNEYKTQTYSAALIRVIQDSTFHGLAPKFYFEATENDGWAKNLLEGARLTLLWGYITNGLPVMTPKFVSPSFSLYLEIADIVSFILARYLFLIGRNVENQNANSSLNIELDPSLLGLIRYTLIDASGDWRYETHTTFPTKIMFKDTDWEKYI